MSVCGIMYGGFFDMVEGRVGLVGWSRVDSGLVLGGIDVV